MTNKDAIYILSGLKRSLNEYCGLNNNGQKAFDMAISALQEQEETVSRKVYEQISWERDIAVMQLKDLGYGLGEKIRTDGDTISRRAAKEHFHKRLIETALNNIETSDIYEDIADNRIDVWFDELPSAQPEIVRCGSCKYAEIADAQDNQDGYTCQFHRGSIWFSGSYCSWGERRTDDLQ